MNSIPYMSRPAGPTGSTRFGNSGQSNDKKWGDTTSKQGEISRIFVGSVDYKTTTCDEIEKRFEKYGLICGIDLNPKNFAFVQFSQINEAQNACQSENGTVFKDKRIEVRVFDKSGHPLKGRVTGVHSRDRSRSPLRAPTGRPMGGPTGTRHGSFVPTVTPDPYPYTAPAPPAVASEPVIGNVAEIIVVNRDQWRYAELIEQRIKRETGIRFIDMLFLHTPSSLNMTLNDLFERQTMYALVITPVNEEHQSVTLHVLHNQTEHRNMPLEDAIVLINKDHQSLTGHPAPSGPYSAQSASYSSAPTHVERSINICDTESKFPEEISYLLRTILSENGPQFLSLKQLDLLIEYFQKEKSKQLSKSGNQSTSYQQKSGQSNNQSTNPIDFEKQRANLLDNPHVQAALSSLIQIGALGSANTSNSTSNSINNGTYGGQQRNNSSVTRRHPLMGTEIPTNSSQSSIVGPIGGLVKYPTPQSYNQYYQF